VRSGRRSRSRPCFFNVDARRLVPEVTNGDRNDRIRGFWADAVRGLRLGRNTPSHDASLAERSNKLVIHGRRQTRLGWHTINVLSSTDVISTGDLFTNGPS
jgi:hypothetical protein